MGVIRTGRWDIRQCHTPSITNMHMFFRFKPDQGIHFFMSIIVCLVPLLFYSFKNWIQTQTEKNLLELRYLKSRSIIIFI
ncbi:MAG: hypothetical protein HWD58_18380 [Bacteroidota bacterium]|nr:MAG: hypothetical protein HWD58_18380 [Bacteroidota bacterium]